MIRKAVPPKKPSYEETRGWSYESKTGWVYIQLGKTNEVWELRLGRFHIGMSRY
jgi:hypothetical protein